MSIFGVEFIFCCPCFLENIVMAMETKCVKNYHFGCFLHRAIKKYFKFKNFTLIKEQFFTCMYYDLKICLHYNKKAFFRLVVESDSVPRTKCYCCYWRAIGKLLKYFPRFIV